MLRVRTTIQRCLVRSLSTETKPVDHVFNVHHILNPRVEKVVQIRTFDPHVMAMALKRMQTMNTDRIKSYKDTQTVQRQLYQLQIAAALAQKNEISEMPSNALQDFFFPTKRKIIERDEMNLVKHTDQQVDIMSAFLGLVVSNHQVTKDFIVRHPKRINKYTILRSPHIDKKSRDQFELRTHTTTYYSSMNFLSEEFLTHTHTDRVLLHITQRV